MIDFIKNLYTRLFTSQKFPNQEKNSVGGKKIGEVYDIDYEIEDGEAKIVFNKKEE